MKKLYVLLSIVLMCGCATNNNQEAPEVTTPSSPVTTINEVTTVTTVSTTITTTTQTETTKVTTTSPKVTTTTSTTTTSKPKETGLVQVTSGDILNKIFAQETFIMYLGTSYCPHCIEYKPHVTQFLKDYKDTVIYYVVLDECDANQTDELVTLLGLQYTPTTYLIIEGSNADNFVGTDDEKLSEMIAQIK